MHEVDDAHGGVATGTVWVAEVVAAVAVWEPRAGAPGTRPLSDDVRSALARELPHIGGQRARVVAETQALVTTALPDRPHWRLRHLGVRPSSRRKGLAAAVLAPVLVRCDAEGTQAAVAVFSYANVRYFRGFGFQVTETTHTTDDGLPLWVLVREPLSLR